MTETTGRRMWFVSKEWMDDPPSTVELYVIDSEKDNGPWHDVKPPHLYFLCKKWIRYMYPLHYMGTDPGTNRVSSVNLQSVYLLTYLLGYERRELLES